MNIVMMTNSYKPVMGGLENSIEIFTNRLRCLGHKVLIVSPKIKGAPDENGVFRVPAIQNFNGSDFSVELPVPTKLSSILKKFKPDIIHSHHPFLIGDTALRAASSLGIPLIFTNHTLYEKNTHYVPLDSKAMKRFVIRLSVGYANLCDYVIVPSQSIEKMLLKRGVKTPIEVVPTGIYVNNFINGDGRSFRDYFNISQDVFLIGTASRIAEEKNVEFLSNAVAIFLKKKKNAYFVVVGSGPKLPFIQKYFERQKLKNRIIITGALKGKQLVNAYKAMDVFTFASHSETQGLVLIEAMAAGVPVVGVDAAGVKDVIIDKKNGRLVKGDSAVKFMDALLWVWNLPSGKKKKIKEEAKSTARHFSADCCAEKLIKVYERAKKTKPRSWRFENSPWGKAMRVLKAEKNLVINMTKAAGKALLGG